MKEPKPSPVAAPAKAKTKTAPEFKTLTLAERLGNKPKDALLDRITNGLTTDLNSTTELCRRDKTKIVN
ncbi:hypothetical protein PTTG_26917 [Puccinia triticina 1-1 BBBD Race 1]|uniref:Uncharacterized protein n=1 Tax=Puccinia triticina (isolate 1-1 / race 1 (BBBD)) TaxID=630390 RepID=A0A180GPR6_PUCT1|nr:hypothetical protein PTTG_26917 [Puccinia triticina 1-1 BBBD Race 1]